MISQRKLRKEDFWDAGHHCTLLSTGEKGLILQHRKTPADEYQVYFEDGRILWLSEDQFLATGLTYMEQSELFWHLKGVGLDDDVIGEIMMRHGGTIGSESDRAFYLLFGMTQDTAAEVEETTRHIEAAMRAGRYDCI